jgi:tetratricopeptide (TPR) repeat protein
MATSVDNPALGSPVEIFYSYSHKDEVLRDELEKHLSILKRQGVIRGWYDRKISAGSEWAGEIDEHLESARIVLLLISSDFLASDYCYDKEMMRAMERHNSGEAVIVPVILRDVDWSGAPFGKLQSLPTDVKAITSWPNRDAAFKDVAVGIRKAIEKMRADGTAAGPKLMPAAATPDCLPGICNLPHLRNPNFTGRDDLLKLLHDSLNPGKPAALTQAMHGLGGVGKTQTAVEYIYRHAAEYDLAWWIRAEEPAKLASDYAALAEPLKLRERSAQDQGIIVQAVRGSLAGCGRWLIVFDNATGPEEIRGYLPLGGTGHVLVTSRNPAFGGVAHPLKVEKMSADEAVEFLLKRTQQNDGAAAAALAKELGYLPLALAHAGAYMEETGTAIASYLKTFSARQTALLAKAKPPEDYPATVATTWEISFRAVEKESEAAGQLMDLCAFLAPDDIGRDMLKSGAAHLPEPLAAAIADDLQWDEAVRALRKYSLVEVQDGALSVHRLVQAVVRDRLDEEGRKKWADAAVEVVNSGFPFDSDDVRTWPKNARVLPHALASADHAEKLQVGLRACGRLLNQVGSYLKGRAELSGARHALERAVRMREVIYGPDSPEVATVVSNLGIVIQDLGDLTGARACFDRALKIDKVAYEPDHSDVATRVNNLGGVLYDLGDLAGARASFDRALKITEAAYGLDHPTVAIRVNNLGNVLRELGDLPGARAHIERAIKIGEAAHGVNHPKVATYLNNLGLVLHALGNLAEARACYERALRIGEASLGVDHLDVAIWCNNFGACSRDLGDLAGARAHFERALRVFERVLGKDHPSTRNAMKNLEGLA